MLFGRECYGEGQGHYLLSISSDILWLHWSLRLLVLFGQESAEDSRGCNLLSVSYGMLRSCWFLPY